jgi:hypothetical protein
MVIGKRGSHTYDRIQFFLLRIDLESNGAPIQRNRELGKTIFSWVRFLSSNIQLSQIYYLIKIA